LQIVTAYLATRPWRWRRRIGPVPPCDYIEIGGGERFFAAPAFDRPTLVGVRYLLNELALGASGAHGQKSNKQTGESLFFFFLIAGPPAHGFNTFSGTL